MSMIKVRSTKDPTKIIEVDNVHFDAVLKDKGWEALPREEPKLKKLTLKEKILKFILEF